MAAAPDISMNPQLVLDLGHRPALDRADFLVSACNEEAVAWIDRWPDWPAPGLVIWGAAACGKSHLGQVWRSRTGARTVGVEDLDRLEPPDILAGERTLYIDDADGIAGHMVRERAVFHLYNLLLPLGGHLLLTAHTPPARWAIGLADLRSRLNALPAVQIASPDDSLLGSVLLKLFYDRQLKVNTDILLYILSRMERSFESAERLVSAIDAAALAGHRAVTLPLVREVLQNQVGSAS